MSQHLSHVGWSHGLALSQMLSFITDSPPQISYEYLSPGPFSLLHKLIYLKYTPTPSGIASGKAFCFKSKLLNSFTQKEGS